MYTALYLHIVYKLKCTNFKPKIISLLLTISYFRGTLEGKRAKPEYDKLLADPMLKYSGLYQDECADLMVVCQIFDQNEPLALPITTSYKSFTSRWK